MIYITDRLILILGTNTNVHQCTVHTLALVLAYITHSMAHTHTHIHEHPIQLYSIFCTQTFFTIQLDP